MAKKVALGIPFGTADFKVGELIIARKPVHRIPNIDEAGFDIDARYNFHNPVKVIEIGYSDKVFSKVVQFVILEPNTPAYEGKKVVKKKLPYYLSDYFTSLNPKQNETEINNKRQPDRTSPTSKGSSSRSSQVIKTASFTRKVEKK